MKGYIVNPAMFVLFICLRLLLAGCTSDVKNGGVGNGEKSTPVNTQSQQEIKIGGSSSIYPALKAIAASYNQQNPNVKITFLENTQTEAGIAGVKNQLLDIGGMSRELKPSESEGKVKYYRFASDALIVATHPSVKGVKNLTAQQLQDIYSGKIKNWREVGGEAAEIVVLDRPEDESGKRLLREHYLGKDLKNSPDAVIFRKEGDLIRAIQATPHSIGAFSRAYALNHKLPVNIVTLAGVAATPETIRNGKYKMIRAFGITMSISPSPTVQAFIDFATSETGGNALTASDYVPITISTSSTTK